MPSHTVPTRGRRMVRATGALITLGVMASVVPGIAQASALDTTTLTGTVAELADARDGTFVVRTEGRLVDVPESLDDGLTSGDTVRLTVGVPDVGASSRQQAEALARGAGEITDVAVTASATPVADLSGQMNGVRTLVLAPVYVGAVPNIPVAELETLAENVSASYSTQTAGGLDLRVQVKPWKQVTSYSDCQSALFNDALAAHGLAAPTPSGRTHVAIITPTACSFWAGLATLGGREIWIAGDLDPVVLAHEFGHNLGLHHSNRLLCDVAGNPVVYGGSCSETEYGDGDDPMGSATRTGFVPTFNAPQAERLGLLTSASASLVSTTTATLQPIHAASGLRALKIPVGSDHLFVEYRPDVRDLGTARPDWAGIQVRQTSDDLMPAILELGRDSNLDDPSPLPLDPTGATLIPTTGLALSVSQVGATATVRTVPVTSDTTAPTAAALLSPSNNAVLSDASPPSFTWTPGSDTGSGVAGERLVLTNTATSQVRTIPVTGGAAAATATNLPGGTYTWKIVTEDRVGRTTSSSTRTITIDTQAPDAAYVTSTWDPCSAAAQTVSWEGGSDTAGPVTYRLRLNGTPVYTGSATTTLLDPAAFTPGSNSVVLETLDTAGNVSEQVSSFTSDAQAPQAPSGLHLQPGPGADEWLLSYGSLGANDGDPATAEYALDDVPWSGLYESLTPVLLDSASTVVTVRSVDQCGGASPWVTVPRESLDTTAPSAPVVSAPAWTTTYPTPTISWTPSIDAQSGVNRYEVLLGGDVVAIVPGTETSAEVYGLVEGANSIQVRARNGRGLTTTSVAKTVRGDDSPPSAPVITAPAGFAVVTNPFTLSWTSATDTGSGLAGYRVTVNDDTYEVGPGTTSLVLSSSAQTSITIDAVDQVGNRSNQDFRYIETDGTPVSSPTGGATLALTGDADVDEGSVTYTLTATSPGTPGAGRAALVRFTPNGSTLKRPWARILLTPQGGGFVGTVRVPLRTSGTLSAWMEETDGRGWPIDDLDVTVTPAPPPPAPTPTALTGWGSGTKVAAGGNVLAYTVTATPGTGRLLRLETRSCTTCTWSLYDDFLTSASSKATVFVPVLSGTKYWRIVAPATESATAAISGTLTVIPSSTIAGWSTTSVSARTGTTIKDGVTITPVKYRSATLQYKSCTSCAWKSYKTLKTSGSYTVVWSLPVAKGTRYWRVYAPTVNGGASTYSSAKKVTGR